MKTYSQLNIKSSAVRGKLIMQGALVTAENSGPVRCRLPFGNPEYELF